jgi:hypothetical protein
LSLSTSGSDLELHLVRHVHGESHSAALELDVVAAFEHVGQGAQPRGDLVAADALVLPDFEGPHFGAPSFVTFHASARRRDGWRVAGRRFHFRLSPAVRRWLLQTSPRSHACSVRVLASLSQFVVG